MRVREQGKSRLQLNALLALVLPTPFYSSKGGLQEDGLATMDEKRAHRPQGLLW